MNVQLLCENKLCSYAGAGPYVMNIPAEAVMDDRNWAAVYCPHCHQQMLPVQMGAGEHPPQSTEATAD